jgi:hypothetical protein
LKPHSTPWKTVLLAAVCLLCASWTVPAPAAEPPALRFNSQGKFKILQLTDTHWPGDNKQKPLKTLEVLNSVLDAEKPDLVALTGDIVTASRAPKEEWDNLTEPIRRRKIPWAAVLGNHDDEIHGTSRRDIVKYLATMPYSLTEEGPQSLDGTGNYIVRILGSAAGQPAFVLYFLDSHAYPKIEAIRKSKDVPSKYGWISFDQIQWYRQSSRQIRAANHNEPLPALAFFHIPLPEYGNDMLLKTLIGAKAERVHCGALNSGMFTALVKEGDVMGVFVGHDHDSDYAGALFGICLAYGRCSGFGGYGKLPRGGRVIELTEGKREFESWIRAGDGTLSNRFSYPAAFQKKGLGISGKAEGGGREKVLGIRD